MGILIALLVLTLVLALHEGGHALAMRKYGIPIAKAGLGIPIPYLTLSFKWPKVFGQTVITLSPILLGAYVSPTEDGASVVERLRYREKCHIYGGGVVANFVTCLILLGVVRVASLGLSSATLTMTVILAALAVVIWVFQKWFSAYVLPVLGLAATALLVYSIVKAVGSTGGEQAIVGPVGVVKMVSVHTQSLLDIAYITAAMSLMIGFMNILPIYPLDGGQVVDAILAAVYPKARSVFQPIGTALFVLIIVLALSSDCSGIIKR